jgi:CBS domain-containing membrane protein
MTDISQIMTPTPIFMSQLSNINKARMLMAEKKIRHLPIKDAETGKVIGMLNQKTVLLHAIKVINSRGLEQLEHTEKSMNIGSIMDTNPAVIDLNANLKEVATSLIEQRGGCVAITENEKLVGVVTSNDFVKLAITQLN